MVRTPGVYLPAASSRPDIDSFSIICRRKRGEDKKRQLAYVSKTATECNVQHGLCLTMVHVLLKPCLVCDAQLYAEVNLSVGRKFMHQTHHWQRRDFERHLLKTHMPRKLPSCDAQILSSTWRGKCCIYCNDSSCTKRHLSVQVIGLLHQDLWLKITPFAHLSLPVLSRKPNTPGGKELLAVFVVHHHIECPILCLTKDPSLGAWNRVRAMEVTNEYRQLLIHCPRSHAPIQSLFKSSLACLIRNNIAVPDYAFPHRYIKELTGIWGLVEAAFAEALPHDIGPHPTNKRRRMTK